MTEELRTTAWNCLPKEFKEEVRKIYNSYQPETVRVCLVMLFSKQNLISDTEEEEMLIVPRKQVQDWYQTYAKQASKTGSCMSEIEEISIAQTRCALLTKLFGNKCKPDEVKPAELQPDTSQKEPFKVGDNITVSGWTVYSIKPSYIELHKKTCVGITHVITVNEKDILSCGYQPQELHVGNKVDITGWKVIRYKNGTLILKRKMAYGFHVINLEESDLRRDTFTLSENGVTLNIKGYDNNAARLQIATAAMQGLLNATSVERFTLRIKPSAIAKAAVEYADALLAEINRKGSDNERDNN